VPLALSLAPRNLIVPVVDARAKSTRRPCRSSLRERAASSWPGYDPGMATYKTPFAIAGLDA